MNKEIAKITLWRIIVSIICLPLSIWMFNDDRILAGIMLMMIFTISALDAIINIIGYRKRNSTIKKKGNYKTK